MARTRASVGAKVSSGKSSKARCSVAAAPRNNVSTGGGEGSSRGSGGGNPVCPRETPKWQKPITSFFTTGNCSKVPDDPDDVEKDTSCNSDNDDVAEPEPPKPKRNIIYSDEEDAEELTITLKPLTGDNSHKINEYYDKNNKGKGIGKKTNKNNIDKKNSSLKRNLEDESDETENVSKKIKVT